MLYFSLFFLLSDDIYAYALAKTLTKVSSPATVGLYSSCQNRNNMILEQMEGMLSLHLCPSMSLCCLLEDSCFNQPPTAL